MALVLEQTCEDLRDGSVKVSNSEASVSIAGAVMPPAIGILGVVQAVELVGVVVQPVGGSLGLVIVLAVVASRCLLLGALADNVKLLARQLDDLFKSLFRSACFLSLAWLDRLTPRADVLTPASRRSSPNTNRRQGIRMSLCAAARRRSSSVRSASLTGLTIDQ